MAADIRTVSQRVEFECAYIMDVGDHKLVFNAHHYKLEVTVAGPINPATGVVIEFRELRALMYSVVPNNTFVYNLSDLRSPGAATARTLQSYGLNPVGYPFTISAENLVAEFAVQLQERINHSFHNVNVLVTELKLRETNDSYVTWNLK